MSGVLIDILPDAAALAGSAAKTFLRLATVKPEALFTVALSGGSTPKALYAQLADEPYRSQVPWERIHFFWGDERHVPPDDEQSNFRMASEALLSKVPLPAENVHRIRGELNDANEAAEKYEHELKVFFGLSEGEFPVFDLVLLGIGEDGHTASLFPGTQALKETQRLCVANWVEKLATWRITLTLPVLNNAANVLFLVCGSSKEQVLKEVLSGSGNFPAQLVQPTHGRLCWIVDRAAAGKLEP